MHLAETKGIFTFERVIFQHIVDSAGGINVVHLYCDMVITDSMKTGYL